MNRGTENKQAVLIFEVLFGLLLVLPWLAPFAGGPSPSVQPWLLALACGTVVWLHRARLSPELVLRAWLVAAVLSAIAGLLQYIGWSASLEPWLVPTNPGEAFGNLRQRNQFATLTNMGLAALLWPAARQSTAGMPRRLTLTLLAALLAMANAASSSRTGATQLVALAALIWIWGLWRQVEKRRLLLTALISYGAATLILPTLIGMDATQRGLVWRLQQGDHACNSRITLWSNVLHLIAARPWLGWGWGELDYAHFITLYAEDRFCEILGNAHNLPLQLAVELGIPVAAVICGGLGALVLSRRPWRETDGTRQVAWAVLALIFLHSLLEYPLWYGPFQMAVLLCAWLLWPRDHGLPAEQRPAWRQWVERLLVTGLLALSAYAEWDYHRISQIYLPVERRAEAYRENTLEKIENSWLFTRQVHFAKFSITPLSCDNAKKINVMAHELLHYSPEARVVEKLIESAALLGKNDEVLFYGLRYEAAYPKEYAHWVARQAWMTGVQEAGTTQREATKLPDFPPCFSNSRTSLMTMPRSTALHMS